jgi:NADPH2:quinone reductase
MWFKTTTTTGGKLIGFGNAQTGNQTMGHVARAADDGFQVVGGGMPDSIRFRAEVRPKLVELAARGDLVVPVSRTFPLAQAREALELLAGQHPGGKLALVP